MIENYAQVYSNGGKEQTIGGLDLICRIVTKETQLYLGQFVEKIQPEVSDLLQQKYPSLVFESFAAKNGCSAVNAANEGFQHILDILSSHRYHMVMLDGVDFAVQQGLLTPAQLKALAKASSDETKLLIIDRFHCLHDNHGASEECLMN